jgi:ribosome maturation factor RimP
VSTGERSEGLVTAVEPVVAALGFDLYDVELAGSGRDRTLRVTIERPAAAGGVDLEAITAVTEALSPVLDQDPAVDSTLRGAYTLEVSSPGLERSLRTPAHFHGAVGSTISVKTRGADGARRVKGVVATADDEGLELDVDGTRERIAYDDVTQARTVFEWGGGAKRGGAASRKKSSTRTKQQKVAP